MSSILIGQEQYNFFETQCQKMKCNAKKEINANFIDYLGFLIGLKYETITKLANKIQQFPTEIIQKQKHKLFPCDRI
jgi:hypothetical protein